MNRDLTPLFEPQTLAIVGVSADPGKWGYWFARDAARGAHRRRVYLVGRNGGEVHGMPVHRSLAELPEAPELVVLSVPAAGLEKAVDDSLAAGARALVSSPVGVGGPRIAVPGGASEIHAGDVNGDGRADLVLLEPVGGPSRRLTTAAFPRGSPPLVETYWLPPSSQGVAVWDLDGSGQADVTVAESPVVVLLGAPSGSLVPGPSVAATAYAPSDGVLAASNYYASSSGCPVTRLGWTASGLSAACAYTPTAPVGPRIALAAGDFTGEGAPDAVFIDDTLSPPVNTPSLRFALDPGSVPTQISALAAPGGTSVLLGNGGDVRHQLAAGPFTTTLRDSIAALLSQTAPSTRNVVRFATLSGPPWTAGWSSLELDPFDGEATAVGIAACPPPPSGVPALLAWNGTGRLSVTQIDAGFVTSTTRLDAAGFPIASAVCADLNGDGIPDVALAGASAGVAEVLVGDGDGGFGRRARFAIGGASAIGDVDGDGIADVVTATGAPGLRALFGGDHQLATGPETQVAVAVDLVALGDLSGSHGAGWTGDAVFQSPLGAQFLAPSRGDGTFGPMDPLPVYTGAASDAAVPDALVVAELGGTAPGRDVLGWHVVPTPPWSQFNRYPNGAVQIVGLVRDAGAARRVSILRGGNSNAVQPIDRDGDGIPDAIAILYSVNAPAGALGVPSPTIATVLAVNGPGFDPIYAPTPFSLSGPYHSVGAFGDSAVFLAGTSSQLVIVTSTSYRFIAAPFTSFSSAVIAPLVPGGPHRLIVTDGAGLVRTYVPSVDAAGQLIGFTPSTSTPAPGTLLGVARQGGTAGSDVLLRAQDEIVPLVRDPATGALR